MGVVKRGKPQKRCGLGGYTKEVWLKGRRCGQEWEDIREGVMNELKKVKEVWFREGEAKRGVV